MAKVTIPADTTLYTVRTRSSGGENVVQYAVVNDQLIMSSWGEKDWQLVGNIAGTAISEHAVLIKNFLEADPGAEYARSMMHIDTLQADTVSALSGAVNVNQNLVGKHSQAVTDFQAVIGNLNNIAQLEGELFAAIHPQTSAKERKQLVSIYTGPEAGPIILNVNDDGRIIFMGGENGGTALTLSMLAESLAGQPAKLLKLRNDLQQLLAHANVPENVSVVEPLLRIEEVDAPSDEMPPLKITGDDLEPDFIEEEIVFEEKSQETGIMASIKGTLKTIGDWLSRQKDAVEGRVNESDVDTGVVFKAGAAVGVLSIVSAITGKAVGGLGGMLTFLAGGLGLMTYALNEGRKEETGGEELTGNALQRLQEIWKPDQVANRLSAVVRNNPPGIDEEEIVIS